MKTTLSCSLLSAALLCSAVSVTQTYRDSGNAITARNGRSIVFRDHDNRPLATLPLPPGNRVNAEMKQNAIRLDLRNSTVNTSRNLPLNFELPKTVSSSGFAGQKIRFTVRLNADRDAEVMMMLMQKTDKWQGSSKRFRIGKNPVTLLFETSASQRLSGLSPRIGFHTPAIYTVEEMRLETFREESTATGNQLPNGGADGSELTAIRSEYRGIPTGSNGWTGAGRPATGNLPWTAGSFIPAKPHSASRQRRMRQTVFMWARSKSFPGSRCVSPTGQKHPDPIRRQACSCSVIPARHSDSRPKAKSSARNGKRSLCSFRDGVRAESGSTAT